MKVGLAALMIVLVGVGAGCGRKEAAKEPPAPQPVEVTQVKRRSMAETLSVVGSLAADETAQIRAEEPGIIREILFSEGQPVEKGDVLFKIDDRELQAKWAEAQARHQLAQADLDRARQLRKSNVIASSEYERAIAEFNRTKAETQLLEVRLSKTEVRAPFSGVVGARRVSPGDYVDSSIILTRVDDLHRLKVEFDVPGRYHARVRPGSRFVVRMPSSGGELEAAGAPVAGELYFVSPVVDASTRSAQVKGFLDDPPPDLKPGLFATIELVLASRDGVLAVPEGAILATSKGTQIIAVREKDGGPVAEFIDVDLGLRAEGYVEVTPAAGTNLVDGEAVVASGVGALILNPGARVEPRQPKQVTPRPAQI